MNVLTDAAALIDSMPDDMTADMDDPTEAQPEEKPAKRKPEPVAEQDEPEGEGEEAQDEAEPEEEAEESEESEEEESDEDDEPSVLTLDNKELKIPKGTPKEVIEAVKGMEADLRKAFTQKTMALADERTAVTAKISEARAEALEASKAEILKAQALLQNLGGFVPREQLMRLRETNRDAYEMARDRNEDLQAQYAQLQAQYAEVDGRISAEKENARKAKADAAFKKLAQTWANGDLNGDSVGTIKTKILSVFDKTAKHYGVNEATDQEAFFGDVLDARMVMIMEDANKWRDLQASKPEVTKRVTSTAKAAPAKAPQTSQERQRDKVGRFEKRRLSMRDTGDFLQQIGMA